MNVPLYIIDEMLHVEMIIILLYIVHLNYYNFYDINPKSYHGKLYYLPNKLLC